MYYSYKFDIKRNLSSMTISFIMLHCKGPLIENVWKQHVNHLETPRSQYVSKWFPLGNLKVLYRKRLMSRFPGYPSMETCENLGCSTKNPG